jgi:transposase
MAKTPQADETALLLKQLLAIELWRAGLSQSEIRTRLAINANTVSQWLIGVCREVNVRISE